MLGKIVFPLALSAPIAISEITKSFPSKYPEISRVLRKPKKLASKVVGAGLENGKTDFRLLYWENIRDI